MQKQKQLLPAETQRLIAEFLEIMRNDPDTEFFIKRETLFQSFGESRLNLPEHPWQGKDYDPQKIDQYKLNNWKNATQADYVLGWVALLTAQKVAPLWERVAEQSPFEGEIYEVPQMLEISEKLLKGKYDLLKAYNELVSDFWYFHRPNLTHDTYHTFCAAIATLSFIIHGNRSGGDFFEEAIDAYSSTAPNKPELHDEPDSPYPIEFDDRKRLEFWEWWLTEAIPQAWDLGQSSYQKKILTDNQ